MKAEQIKPTLFALLAAALYAVNSPLSKLLLEDVPATMMAALLYLGAGIGVSLMTLARKATGHDSRELPLTKKELPYVVAMVLLDIAAPLCLMLGLTRTTAANASLLNNFETVATSVIALCAFHERISPRLWLAIALVTLASLLLSFEDASSLSFSWGSLLVLLACAFWGLENNCTRMLSGKDPLRIVIVKGFGSGLGALLIAFAAGERLPALPLVLAALALGFVAYGLSITCYIYAQRGLGAARTSAWYAVSPFVDAGLSLLIFRQTPSLSFLAALAVMASGAWFAATDGIRN